MEDEGSDYNLITLQKHLLRFSNIYLTYSGFDHFHCSRKKNRTSAKPMERLFLLEHLDKGSEKKTRKKGYMLMQEIKLYFCPNFKKITCRQS